MKMALLTVSINDPGFDKKSAEAAYLQYCLGLAAHEVRRGQGKTTSGTIIGVNAAGVGSMTLGSWTLTSSATKD